MVIISRLRYAKPSEGTGCQVQPSEHTYRYLAEDFHFEGGS